MAIRDQRHANVSKQKPIWTALTLVCQNGTHAGVAYIDLYEGMNDMSNVTMKMKLYEPLHDNSNNLNFAPSEDTDQS